MIKYFIKTFLLVLFPFLLHAQLVPQQLEQSIDSVKSIFNKATNDSVRYRICRNIYDYYEESNRDSALYYAEQELSLARKNNEKLAEVHALDNKGYQLTGLGQYAGALQCLQQAFNIAEDPAYDNIKTWPLFTSTSFTGNNRLLMLAYTHHIFAILMWQTGNLEQEIFHFKEARQISKNIGHTVRQMMADMNLGRAYVVIEKPDSAIIYENEAEQLTFQNGYKKYLGNIYAYLGWAYFAKKENETAGKYYYRGVEIAIEQNNLAGLSNSLYFQITKFYLAQGKKDSALHYALKNLQIFQTLGTVAGAAVNLGTIYKNIYLCYKMNNQRDSAYKYQGLALNAIDSLSKIRIKNLSDFQIASFSEQMRLQNIEKEKTAYQDKVRTWFLLGGIAILLLLSIIFYRNNRQKHKAKIKIEKAYDELKSTQAQLIQSEKMASLGELTAGIAHEIQNPLNFVNNFSEVNVDLLAEMKDEIDKGNTDEAKEIASDVIANEQKINHHGKRADAIVKGMLQHSRTSTGQKELTDINALADEYLRLSYHGLRAKDKLFNATMKTDFDTSIGKINIIPQDIGRVLLNLYNNAFYAVNARLNESRLNESFGLALGQEKQKLLAKDLPGFENLAGLNAYEPTVSVSTKKSENHVIITVSDNGNGIPQNIVDKIFQPFFTTKPTGEGTGLGLSLAYDIVKAHGGEIKVETLSANHAEKEGKGTTFIIQLPES